MIGIVIVTHGGLSDALIDTAALILGARPDAVVSVSIHPDEDVDRLRDKVARGVKAANRKEGVLVLTDMFGGTPSNLSYSLLEEGRVEVLSGVNLPVLLKALDSRDRMELPRLAEVLETFGKRSISLASGILKGNPRG
jgi:mannose PTS system EIIA component